MAYNKITLATQHRFEELKEYRAYLKEKKAIQKKYRSKPWDIHTSLGPGNYKDSYDENWWKEWQLYKQDMLELLFRPNGNFQQFTWLLISEKEEEERERRAKGYNRSIYY